MTGFNRRFSPAVAVVQEALAGRATPLIATYQMNAGYIPRDHWVHGREGGGRNIGEACHVYDLFDTLTSDSRTANSRRINSRTIARVHRAKVNCNCRGSLPTTRA